MAFQFTYSNSPSSEPRDAVRLLIGDTDENDPLLTDDEVAFYLTEASDNQYKAASEACKGIAAKLGRRPDYMVGRTLVSNQKRAQDFLKLAEELRRKYLISSATPFAGGIKESDKEAQESDSDRALPYFTRKSFENPPVNPLETL